MIGHQLKNCMNILQSYVEIGKRQCFHDHFVLIFLSLDLGCLSNALFYCVLPQGLTHFGIVYNISLIELILILAGILELSMLCPFDILIFIVDCVFEFFSSFPTLTLCDVFLTSTLYNVLILDIALLHEHFSLLLNVAQICLAIQVPNHFLVLVNINKQFLRFLLK